MNRSQKIVLLSFVLIFFMSNLAFAACTGSSPSWTSTPDYQSVASCVSQAAAGNTINVTAGSGSETWPANAVVIPANKPVKLIGPGRDNLTIKLSDYSPAIIVGPYAGSVANPGSEISGFTFHSYVINQRSCAIKVSGSGWRIHHNKYQNDINNYAYNGLFVTASDIPEASGIKISGLVDNNIIVNGRVTPGGYAFAVESAIWSDDIGLGTDKAVYVEDNNFYTTDGLAAGQNTSDLARGGKIVFRYNTVVNGGNLAHGIQSSTMRGSRSWEFYGNSYSTALPSQRVIELKSGTGVIFNNYFNGYYYNSIVSFWHQRSETSSGGTAGICDGTSQWDGNAPGLSGGLCRDQIGAGKDTSLWSAVTALPAPAQAAAPAYLWGVYKTYNGTTSLVPVAIPYTSSAVHIKANRDYYEQTSTFNGTSGVGCGTLDNRPAACTPGVAYWATNQSCSNMTGMVGANPATPISGTLYKCNASGQWNTHYSPYTYPHPLRNETTTPVVTTPSLYSLAVTSTNGTVTSSPAGIDCGSTCSYSYTTDTIVTLTATPNTGYALSNWSGACTGSSTCTVTMTEAKSVTANFTKIEKPLEVSKPVTNTGSGTVNSSDAGISCGNNCSQSYEYGTIVTLTATPDSGSAFYGWSGDCTGTTTTCQVTMTDAKNVSATFLTQDDSNAVITTSKKGNGIGRIKIKSVTLASSVADENAIDCGNVCVQQFENGSTVTLTAEADSGSTFSGWEGACSGTGDCVVNVNSATSVIATFSAVEASSSNPAPSLGADGGGGGGCFIATAAYGSYLDPQVMVLREFRDKVLLNNYFGRLFVKFYYANSPVIAHTIAQNEVLKVSTRLALTPVIYAVAYPYAAGMILMTAILIAIFIRRKKTYKLENTIGSEYFQSAPRKAVQRIW